MLELRGKPLRHIVPHTPMHDVKHQICLLRANVHFDVQAGLEHSNQSSLTIEIVFLQPSLERPHVAAMCCELNQGCLELLVLHVTCRHDLELLGGGVLTLELLALIRILTFAHLAQSLGMSIFVPLEAMPQCQAIPVSAVDLLAGEALEVVIDQLLNDLVFGSARSRGAAAGTLLTI